MIRLAYQLGRALDPPLRFLLACAFALAAGMVGVARVVPTPGFPWPGRIRWGDPGIECLFLGMVLAACLTQAGLAPRWRPRPTETVALLYLGLGAAGVVHGLVPAAGLARILTLLGLALAAFSWARTPRREDVLRGLTLTVFVLILIGFVLPRTLHGLVDAIPGGKAGVWLAFGDPAHLLPPAGDEYRVFLVLVLFAASLAARWPEAPDEAAGREALQLAGPASPVSGALPAEGDPASLPEAGTRGALPTAEDRAALPPASSELEDQDLH